VGSTGQRAELVYGFDLFPPLYLFCVFRLRTAFGEGSQQWEEGMWSLLLLSLLCGFSSITLSWQGLLEPFLTNCWSIFWKLGKYYVYSK
jgi:hypothetical protein